MVTITSMFTMDPAQVWTPKSTFFPNEPFGINMIVTASPELVRQRARYDLIFHMVNPGLDPHVANWFAAAGGFDTIDWNVDDTIFQWESFGHWVFWGQYSDPVAHVQGGDKEEGVFSIRGSISVQGSDLFDLSDPFAFNYRVRKI